MTRVGPALRFSQVTKAYGSVQALRETSFVVPRGSICGFVGPNGAGKTTSFSIAAGFLRPDSGTVDVLGEGPFQVHKHRGRVGVLPQDSELPVTMPVQSLLIGLARLQGMTRAQAIHAADKALDLVQLRDVRARTIRQLSHGMRRRVEVAQALLGSPELVLLDEPTSGLDPHLIVHMQELFRSMRSHRTLLISSHVLAHLESICDHVIFLERGQTIATGAVASLTQQATRIRIWIDGEAPDLEPLCAALPDLELTSEPGSLVVSAPGSDDIPTINAQVLRVLLDRGVRIQSIQCGESLERAYLRARSKSSSVSVAAE